MRGRKIEDIFQFSDDLQEKIFSVRKFIESLKNLTANVEGNSLKFYFVGLAPKENFLYTKL